MKDSTRSILVMTCTLSICATAVALMTNAEVASLRSYETTSFDNGFVYTKSADLKAWVDARNLEARTALDAHPLASEIKARATELAAGPAPLRFATDKGEFYLKAGSLVFINAIDGVETMLVDKATLAGHVILEYRVSPDGSRVAFATAFGGSDSNYWSVVETATAKTLTLAPIRTRIYPVSWSLDSKGLYYSKPARLADEFQMVKDRTERGKGSDVAFHVIGDDQQNDRIVFKNRLISSNFAIDEIPGTNLLVAHRTKSGFAHQLALFVGTPNPAGGYDWKDIIATNKHVGRFVTATKDWIYALSSEAGNRYGIVGYSVSNPSVTKVIVAEQAQTLNAAQRVGDQIVAQYFDSEFNNRIALFDLSGNLVNEFDLASLSVDGVSFPGRGTLPPTVSGGSSSSKFYFTYSAIELPTITLTYDVPTKALTVLPAVKKPLFSGVEIDSRVEKFSSADSAHIPIQIYQRKGVTTPKFYYLYYYGSNGVLNSSGYNLKFQHMLELGGAVALVGVRGGGEKGASWYKSGMSDRRISAYDVAWASKYVKAKHPGVSVPTVAAGRSYGGMLTNAVMTRYPGMIDIFVPIVGIADPEYFMTDYFGSLGWDDLGISRDNDGQIEDSPSARQFLQRWSPSRQVGSMSTLGSVILFTAESDERTGPHQTYLMTELLRRKFPSNKILMVETKGGHNARSEALDEATFVAQVLGITALDLFK